MVSFKNIFFLARYLNQIEFRILEINVESNGFFLFKFDRDKKDRLELVGKLEPIIKDLNSMIDGFNKLKNKNFTFLRANDLVKIDFNQFRLIILRRKDFSETGKELALIRREQIFEPLEKSIQDFVLSFDRYVLSPFGGPKKKWYLRDETYAKFGQIMEVYSFGFFEFTVLLCCRILEESINDYFILLKKCKKIHYKLSEMNSWSLDTKINILYNEGLITESQKSKLLSIKWDRNICAHPSSKKELLQIQNDADAIITLALNLIHEFEKRIRRIVKLKKN